MGRKELIDMTQRRHGRLVGVAYSHTAPNGRAHWLFACDCGQTTVADGGNVRAGTTASCGCLHREISAARLTVHGHRAARRHGPTYQAWQQMRDAVHNPRSPRWAAAGGRGVGLAPAWAASFEAFLADMGERPPGTRLARRDATQAFAPANCRWDAVEERAARARRGWLARRSAAMGESPGDAPPRPPRPPHPRPAGDYALPGHRPGIEAGLGLGAP